MGVGGLLLPSFNRYDQRVTLDGERHLNASRVLGLNAPRLRRRRKPEVTSRSPGITDVTRPPPPDDPNVLNIHVSDRGDEAG